MDYRTAFITGGGSGIGQAIATMLANEGVRVALAGRDLSRLEAARESLGKAGESALILACDVTERAEIKEVIESAEREMGSIDILVCNAGINIRDRSLRSLQPEDWDRVVTTNLTGAFNTLYYALPGMRTRGKGLVIQLSSLAGKRASTVGGVAYSASKFGQSALGICLGREERGRGIRSTVLYLGEVNTTFLDIRAGRPGAIDDERKASILQPADVAAAVRFIAELPPNAHVAELVMKPAIDDFS